VDLVPTLASGDNCPLLSSHVDLPKAAAIDIARLEIAMDDTAAVSERDRVTHRDQDLENRRTQ